MNETLERVRRLRGEIADLERDLRIKKSALEHTQGNCNHRWGEVVYDPKVRAGYTSPGDPPGTMGIDWRGPTYVPREETPRWRRTCGSCDLTQYTENTTEHVTKNPVFR
ncbi:MAG TPA: hypothetical protein VN495_02145 [Candidatus Paceibacterota bacterium]|nr:hypothetical protein [Candidatus Paceibacterota bacterium]